MSERLSEASAVARVVVVDDHPLYRSALRELFERTADFQVVGTAEGLGAALELLAACPSDMVILDLRLPDAEGLSGVRLLRERWPALRILLISGALDAETVRSALAAGASGLLPKSYDHNVILAAARLVAAGAQYVPPELTAALAAAGTAESHESPTGGALDRLLSAREIDILRRFSRGESNKEVARDLGLAEITIKVAAQRIARKLGVKNRTAAVARALAENLI